MERLRQMNSGETFGRTIKEPLIVKKILLRRMLKNCAFFAVLL
jgi:hypothetical protein